MKLCNPVRALTSILIFSFAAAFYSTSGAQVVPTASLNVERRGHTATQLADGKILVVGGENANGPVSQAEVFDPSSHTFSALTSSNARTDHTATLMADGRVLVTGGRDSYSLLDSTEIFNPATNSFSPGPSMRRARAGHSATVRADGKILLVGGDSDGSAEIYDPDTQSSSLLGSRLNVARALHGAGLLKDGRVLIAGGVDPGNSNTVFDSAEIFDPQSLSFSLTTTPMMIARGLPTFRVLPDGKVQVIGGDAEWSMEMFNPETDSFNALVHLPPTSELLSATLSTQSRAALITTSIAQHPTLQGALSDELINLLDRADHSATEITQSNQALVAGGLNSRGEFLASSVLVSSSSATVTTDWLDYAPGEIVTITGTGWLPGENVSMLLHEEPETHADTTISSVADDKGNFTNTDFSPAPPDLGRTFTLTALGQSSGFAAQTAFADAAKVGSVSVGSQTGSVTVGTAGSVTYAITVGRSGSGGGAFSATLSVTTALPTGVTASFSPNPLNFAGGDTSLPSTLTLSTTAATPAGSTSFTVQATGGAGTATASGTLTVKGLPTTTTVDPATGTFGGTVNLHAHVEFAAGGNLNGGTVNFFLNGNSVGSATTNASGNTNLNGASLAGIAVGTYPTGVSATLVATPSWASSTGTAALTVTSACTAPSITTNPIDQTVVYGNNATYTAAASGNPTPTVQWQLSTNGGASWSDIPSATSTTLTVTAPAVSPSGNKYRAVFTNNCGGTATATTTVATLTVNKADPTVTFTGAPGSAPYQGTFTVASTTNSSSSPVYTSSGACSNVSTLYTMTSGTGTCTSTVTWAADANYNGATRDQTTTATKVDQAIVTVSTPSDATFGQPGGTATASGGSGTGAYSFSAGASTACSVNAASGDITVTSGTGTCSITATRAGDGNYNASAPSAAAIVAINKAAATVVLSNMTQTYTGSALTPSATTTPAGLAILWTNAPQTNAGSYAVTAAVNDANYEGSASGTFIINKAAATVVLSNMTQTYTGSALTPSATTTPAGLSILWTNAPQTNAGSYAVTAAVNDANYEGSASGTFIINKAAPIFSNLIEPTIILGTAWTTLTGKISAGALVPTGSVAITLNGVTQYAAIQGDGSFASTFETSTLPVNSNPTTYYYAGNTIFYTVGPVTTNSVHVIYASAGLTCYGDPGHQILQPINVDGTSVFKKGSTVPAKFRVCNAGGYSIGKAGIANSFKLYKISAGVIADIDEAIYSTTSDTAFRWSSTDQLWIFNISTKSLAAGQSYMYDITLNDGTHIYFQFGLK
jgi:hypothetical protein